MTKKEKDLIREEFKKKMSNVVVKVCGTNWSLPINEYVEQESWARPFNSPEIYIKKEYVPSKNPDSGILSKESVFETKLYHLLHKINAN